jgi:hypothetical protein
VIEARRRSPIVAFEERFGHGDERFPVRDDDREAGRLYAGLPDPSRRSGLDLRRRSHRAVSGARDSLEADEPPHRWSAKPVLVLTNSAKPTKKRAKENNEK